MHLYSHEAAVSSEPFLLFPNGLRAPHSPRVMLLSNCRLALSSRVHLVDSTSLVPAAGNDNLLEKNHILITKPVKPAAAHLT